MQSIAPSARPVAHRGDVGVGAQRRVHLEHRVVATAHSAWVSVKWWVVASQVTGRPSALACAHHLDRAGRGEVLEVDPGAGEAGQGEVAEHHQLLGLGRLAGDAEAGRPLPLVHVAAGGEHRVLAVLGEDDALAEAAGVLHGPAHEAGVGDAGAVVGEEPHAELGHLAERRELLARPADGDGARGAHVARRRAAELEHLAHDAGVVDGRDGVGHGEDARVAAEGGGPGAGLDGLGLLLAGLAEVAVEVDEARG